MSVLRRELEYRVGYAPLSEGLVKKVRQSCSLDCVDFVLNVLLRIKQILVREGNIKTAARVEAEIRHCLLESLKSEIVGVQKYTTEAY
jgi:hypothetical protein